LAANKVTSLDIEVFRLVSHGKFSSVKEVLSWPRSFRKKMAAILTYQQQEEKKAMDKAKRRGKRAR